MAWYCLRGHTVAFRLTIRDGGLDLRNVDKCIISEVQIHGADVAFRVSHEYPGLVVYDPDQNFHISIDPTGDSES